MTQPQKLIFPKFRTRPHSNPLSDQIFDYPLSPAFLDWGKLFSQPSKPLWCDLGCGYGGLLETLGPRFPDVNIIGMELRGQVVDYVENRILKLRRGDIPFEELHINPIVSECEKGKSVENQTSSLDNTGKEQEDEGNQEDSDDGSDEEELTCDRIFIDCPELILTDPIKNVDETTTTGSRPSPPVISLTKDEIADYRFLNIGVIRTNSMKNMTNYFPKGGLSRLFILFPDPHWKRQHIRRRVVCPSLLDEYAYCLQKGARVYTITDVPVVHHWIVWCFERHPLFRRVPEDELVCISQFCLFFIPFRLGG